MATKTRITEEEYLRSTFEPDAEFVGGEIAERSLPDYLRSKIQGLLLIWFERLMERHRVQPCPGLRMCLGPCLYRVPDVVLIAGPEPEKRFPDTPPLVTVEIVSLDDRYPDVIGKLEEYRTWGVPNIWLVDPHKKRLGVYTVSGLQDVSSLTLPEFNFEIPARALFAGL
ncbi:MAG: Uma2 family endonuclease [Acidobacteriota bacterium]|nr:Uma2 family endonuclease [Acidobacteriota bacterium]